jgi:hypothetical protein
MIELNLLPDIKAEDLISSFIKYCNEHGRSGIKKFFTSLSLPDRIVTAVCSRTGVDAGKNAAEITKKERKTLLASFSGLSFIVKQLDGKKKAMCTAGGVDTSEIKPATMESKLIENLYFAGEVIDVDGDSGGFNLQFAFSSAYAAVDSISKSG